VGVKNKQIQIIPDGLADAFRIADDQAEMLGLDHWLSTTQRDYYWLWDTIGNAENKGIIHPGQSVLDLGSGSGSSTMQFASRGYRTIGIELDLQLHIISRDVSSRARILFGKNIPRFVHGSYYPKEYIRGRKGKKDLVSELQEPHSAVERQFLFLECKEDVYEREHIDLRKINIFYAYKWAIQMPTVVDMFIKYSNRNAILMMLGPFDHNDIISEHLGLRKVADDCYRK
jgi:hypothetical protein